MIDFPGARHLFAGRADEVLDAIVTVVVPEVPTPVPRQVDVTP